MRTLREDLPEGCVIIFEIVLEFLYYESAINLMSIFRLILYL